MDVEQKDYAQELSANNLLSTPVFAVCIRIPTKTVKQEGIRRCRISGEPTILCSRRMKVSYTSASFTRFSPSCTI